MAIFIVAKNPKFLNVNTRKQKMECENNAKTTGIEIIKEYVGIPWNEDDPIKLATDPLSSIKETAEKGEVDTLLFYSFYCIGRQQDIETPIAIQAFVKVSYSSPKRYRG